MISAIESGDYSKFENILNEKNIYMIDVPAGTSWYFILFPPMGSIKTPLQAASAKGDYRMVKSLLDKGASANFSAIGEEPPINAVINSESGDKLSIIKLLVDHGADPEKKDSYGVCPILNVVYSSCYRAVDAKHNIYECDEQKMDEIIKIYCYLLKCVKEKEPVDPNTGETALLISARMGNHKMLDYLINNQNMDINATDIDGRSALFLDPDKDSEDDPMITIAKLLLNSGIDAEMKDNNGQTAYQYAIDNGYRELALTIKNNGN